MVDPDDLALYELPIGEQRFADNPDPFMQAARETHPWLARSAVGFVLTDYDAVNDIMGMDQCLSTPAEHIVAIMGGQGTNWGRFQTDVLIARSGADHARMRGAVNKAFLPRAVKTYAARIDTIVSDLLDQWTPRGAFDFTEFAEQFPVAVMFGLLGVPRQRIAEVRDWLEVVGQSFSLDASLFPAIDRSFDQLWGFVDRLIMERRKVASSERDSDLLDRMIEAEASGQLSDLELRDMVLFLFVAGYDTSKNQLAHAMNYLIDRPELYERCARDLDFCKAVVEETLRHAGVATSYRNVAESFTYRGVKFDRGAMLVFPLGIVGRYSGPFDDPGAFDPGRENAARHTAFSRGMHICLGQFLARLQITRGLQLIAQRLREPRRTGPVQWRLFPGVWGPSQLPITFDPAN